MIVHAAVADIIVTATTNSATIQTVIMRTVTMMIYIRLGPGVVMVLVVIGDCGGFDVESAAVRVGGRCRGGTRPKRSLGRASRMGIRYHGG